MKGFEEVLVYIIIFLLLFSLKNKKNNNIYFFLLLIFTIMRFDVGWDYRWYYSLATRYEFREFSLFMKLDEILEYISNNSSKGFDSWNFYRIEIINKVFYKIIWNLRLDPQFIIVIYGFFTLYFIKKGLDNEKIYTKNTWLFYYTFPLMWFSHISIMRQGLAVSVVFYAYKFIKRREFVKYSIFILIASLIHKSAALMIVLYFLYNLKYIMNISVYLFGLLTAPIMKHIVIYIITNFNIPILIKYRYFILNKIGDGGTKIFWIMLLVYILILFGILLDKNLYKKNKFLITIVLSGLYIYIGLIDFGHAGPRLAAYFLIFLLYLVPWIEQILKKIKVSINIISISLFIIMLLTLYVDINGVVRRQFVPYYFYKGIETVDLNGKWVNES